MQLRLRDNLHWCVCEERVIFLDLEADRYFCLSRSAEPAFLQLAGGQGRTAEIGPLHGLIARGLLIEDDGAAGFTNPPLLPPACSDLVDGATASAGVRGVVGALAYEAWATWILKRRPLLEVVRGAQLRARRRSPSPAGPENELRRIVSSFSAASLILPAADRCLVRALALHAVCCRSSLGARMVFGVRANPFAAHCWVQRDDKVLIGEFEQVRLFTPMLAL
jgi:hypothetical protein